MGKQQRKLSKQSKKKRFNKLNKEGTEEETEEKVDTASTSGKQPTKFELTTYAVTKGASNYGMEYQIKLTALMALRCAKLDCKEVMFGSNVEMCGKYDDIVVHLKMKDGSEKMKLVQIKLKNIAECSEKIKRCSLRKMFCREYFELDEHEKGFSELKDCVAIRKLTHSNIHYDDVEFILFTNKKAHSCVDSLLEISNQSHEFLNTKGTVYKFNVNNMKSKNHDEEEFLNKVHLYLNQSNERDIKKLIIEEVQQIVPNAHNLIESDFAMKFIDVIAGWSKGKSGRSFTLTKTQITTVITELLLDSCSRGFQKLIGKEPKEMVKSTDFQIMNEIIARHNVLLISKFDDNTIDYLRIWSRKWFSLTNDDLTTQLLTYQESITEDVNDEIRKTLIPNDEMKVYEALWRLGHAPKFLLIENEEECLAVVDILIRLNSDRKFIVLRKEAINGLDVPLSLSELHSNLQELILDQNITLQGKKQLKLRKMLEDVPDSSSLISMKDVISILSGHFNIGNVIELLPFYISRKMPKIFLESSVFGEPENSFVIMSDDETRLRKYLQTLNLQYHFLDSIDHNKEVWLNSNEHEIVCCKLTDIKVPNLSLKYNIHFLKFFYSGNNNLQWITSRGSVDSLKPHIKLISKDTAHYDLSGNKSDSIFSNFENSLNIISASPGMGKSTLLDAIALHVSENIWILRINLNRYKTYFYSFNQRPNKAETHLQYFAEKILEEYDCNTEFNLKLFTYFLDNKRILVLVDGFDELATLYEKSVTKMIHSIRIENYSVWITTRPEKRIHLENEFNSISYTLQPFDKIDQTQFLTEYFINESMQLTHNFNSDKIRCFVVELLQFIKGNLGDRITALLGIPLQSHMIATIYSEKCMNYVKTRQLVFGNKLDVLSLYEIFIEKKREELIKKYGEEYACDMVTSSEECHMICAMKVLFQDKMSIDMEEQFKKFVRKVNKNKIKCGILSANGGDPLFIHQSFAEYYSAKWLCENYDIPEHTQLVQDIIIKMEESSFELTRNFFDRHVAKGLDLHTAVLNLDLKTIRNLIEENKNSINDVDKLNRTPLYLLRRCAIQFGMKYDGEYEDKSNITLHKSETEITKVLIEAITVDVENLDAYKYAERNHCLGILNEFAPKLKNIVIPDDCLEAYLYHCTVQEFCNLLLVILQNEEIKSRINNLCLHLRGGLINLLHFAAEKGKNSIIEILTDNGIDINIICKKGQNALHFALKKKRTKTIGLLPNKRIDINSSDTKGRNALHLAINLGEKFENKYEKIAKMLINKGIDINASDKKGRNALHLAIEKNSLEVTKILINKIIDLNAIDKEGRNALHIAVRRGWIEITEMLLNKQIDITAIDKEGRNALHVAAYCGKIEIMKILISNGIVINASDNNERNALHMAVCWGEIKIMELLINEGIDLNAIDNEGKNALHVAAYWGKIKITELLINKGIDINAIDKQRMNALHIAAYRGKIEIAEILINKGIDLNAIDEQGRNALHLAINLGEIKITEMLINKGVDITVIDKTGRNALRLAADLGRVKIMEMLLSKANDINAIDKEGSIKLHLALKLGKIEMTEMIINKITEINAMDVEGSNALYLAIDLGKIEIAEMLINKGIDINAIDDNGRNALHSAINSGKIEIAKMLINKGIDINAIDDNGRNALHLATYRGMIEITEVLLNKQIDITTIDNQGKNALHLAAKHDHTKTIDMLLNKGIDVYATDKKGMNALHLATYWGNIEVTEMLLMTGIDINGMDAEGRNAFLLAAERGSIEITEMLIKKGIDINVIDNRGRNAFHLAAEGGSIVVTEMLINKGFDINAIDKEGRNALHLAINVDKIVMAKILINKGININANDMKGRNALHLAIERGSIAVTEMLINKGSDIKGIDEEGRSILHLAADVGTIEIMEMLIKKGIDINVIDKNGRNVLHLTAEEGRIEMTEMLLNNGIDINAIDKYGKNALHFAVRLDKIDITKMLLNNGIDINAIDKEGKSALYYSSPIVRKLIMSIKN